MNLNFLPTVIAIVSGAILSGCSLFQWAMPAATLSDSNLFAMLDTINLSEIDAANLAKAKASSEGTQMFASRMLTEHTTMMEETQLLAQRIHVQPQPPALASAAMKTHQKTMEELRTLSGRDFDRAYMKYQIKMHEQTIDLIQDTANSAKSPQLQEHLRRARPDLDSHLLVAKSIERQLVAQY